MIVKIIIFLATTIPIIICYCLNNSFEKCLFNCELKVSNIMIFVVLLFVDISLSWLLMQGVSKKLPNGPSININIKQVELTNDKFLPIYLGYIFVSFSLNKEKYFALLFLVIVLGTLIVISNGMYFNPILSLFKYNFYIVESETYKTKILIITKKRIDENFCIELKCLKKLTNNTLIDTGV